MTTRWPVCVAVAAALLAAPAMAGEINKHFHERFDVDSGAVLHLDHGDGDVRISSWDDDAIEVDVRYHMDYSRAGLGKDPEFDVEFRQRGDEVRVIGHESGFAAIGFVVTRHHEYIYEIKMPSYVKLSLEGDDGDIDVKESRGNLDLELDDGDVDLRGIGPERAVLELGDGDLRLEGFDGGRLEAQLDDGNAVLRDSVVGKAVLRLDDGDVELTRCSGDFELLLDDGEALVHRHGGGSIKARTEDGDVEIELMAGADVDLDIETVDGDIVVEVAPGAAASFDLDTDEGRVKVDLPSADVRIETRRRASGKLGDGAGTIRLHSEEGNITLREAK